MSAHSLLLVQPFQPPDGEGHLLSLQEIQALPVIVEHGAESSPGGSDVPVPRVVFLSVPVYKGKLGPRQPAGIFRVLLEMDLRVGGVDLQLVHLQPLAVRPTQVSTTTVLGPAILSPGPAGWGT